MDCFAVPCVGHADGRGIADSRERMEKVVEDATVNIEGSPRVRDHVSDAADEGEVALLVPESQVAGPEPAIDDGCSREFGVPPVALHDLPATDYHLADDARGCHHTVVLAYADLHARYR